MAEIFELLLDAPKHIVLANDVRVSIAARMPDGSETELIVQLPGGGELSLPHAVDIGEHHIIPLIYCIHLDGAEGALLFGGEIAYVLGVNGGVLREFRMRRKEKWAEYWTTEFVVTTFGVVVVYESGAFAVSRDWTEKWHVPLFFDDHYLGCENGALRFEEDDGTVFDVDLASGSTNRK